MKSCYDCSHCEPCVPGQFGLSEGKHLCTFRLPAWANDCTNDSSYVIEEDFHDATMANECFHYAEKVTGSTLSPDMEVLMRVVQKGGVTSGGNVVVSPDKLDWAQEVLRRASPEEMKVLDAAIAAELAGRG